MTGLIRYDAMCRAIDAAYAIDEVKAIHDRAAMLQAAARIAKNVEAETRAYEIRMRAARKAGALSKKIEKAQGGHNKKQTPGQAESARQNKTDVLNGAGISTQQASDWERLAAVSNEEFEGALATKSVRDLIDRPMPVEGDALLLYGMMHDFERRWLKESPEFFMSTMTETMVEDVMRIAPLAAEWLSTIRDRERVP
jgi:hypothetical protein